MHCGIGLAYKEKLFTFTSITRTLPIPKHLNH
jgi:hypothetical protein